MDGIVGTKEIPHYDEAYLYYQPHYICAYKSDRLEKKILSRYVNHKYILIDAAIRNLKLIV